MHIQGLATVRKHTPHAHSQIYREERGHMIIKKYKKGTTNS